ncbi:hypothetical protein CHS0354_001893 [Potamilus streckersoni]|uniref:Uncharacterized protein n=1 Tax=Potamilus streckersoni TaxID=2493646 RepID=A0AAE0W4Q9_9BIVA|nr:hypothetical protein CHS0354_001893 [Potamilus streckersoni]
MAATAVMPSQVNFAAEIKNMWVENKLAKTKADIDRKQHKSAVKINTEIMELKDELSKLNLEKVVATKERRQSLLLLTNSAQFSRVWSRESEDSGVTNNADHLYSAERKGSYAFRADDKRLRNRHRRFLAQLDREAVRITETKTH